jgi:hypothetical protein
MNVCDGYVALIAPYTPISKKRKKRKKSYNHIVLV